MIPSELINSLVSRADSGPCGPAVKAHGGYSGAGHFAITGEAAPGFQSAWYKPRHERR